MTTPRIRTVNVCPPIKPVLITELEADLLTALKGILADIDDMPEIPEQISGAALCIARQVVARAEGAR